MKRYILIIALTILPLCSCKQNKESFTLLVGTYTDSGSKGIYSYNFNPKDGSSESLSVMEVSNPSFLALTPDLRRVYSVSEQEDGPSVSAFAFEAESGILTPLESRQTKGRGPCHVSFIGNEVISANYSSGSISIFPLGDDGSMQEATALSFHGNGPDPSRQDKSYLHSTQLTPDGKFVLAVDLGGDCFYRFPVSEGRISDTAAFKIPVPAGSGPRHFTFSKDSRYLYLINELSGSVCSFSYNDGQLSLIQEIQADTLYARGSADIHFSPDGRFLYASNRLKGDGIAIFRQDSDSGLLTKVGYQETAIHPRNFAITPGGEFLLAACRDRNVIQVFSRNKENGLLTDTGKDISVPHPVCVLVCEQK